MDIRVGLVPVRAGCYGEYLTGVLASKDMKEVAPSSNGCFWMAAAWAKAAAFLVTSSWADKILPWWSLLQLGPGLVRAALDTESRILTWEENLLIFLRQWVDYVPHNMFLLLLFVAMLLLLGLCAMPMRTVVTFREEGVWIGWVKFHMCPEAKINHQEFGAFGTWLA